MRSFNKHLLALACAFVSFSLKADTGVDNREYNSDYADEAGQKHAFKIHRGDCSLTLGGKAKIESYFLKNAAMLNKKLPDQNSYLKETVDLTFDVAYGEKKYGHKAAEFFLGLRQKGVWGYAFSYADKDAGALGPTSLKLSESVFGSHTHTTGKPLIWLKDGWLMFSWNAALGVESKNVHTVKAGWFPFEMGRGIAFGGFYGLNKELVGLYSYNEDKAAPGILFHGDLIKDVLTYDLYYARFEERAKSFGDTTSVVRKHVVGVSPLRGLHKNDDAIAGRLKWVAVNDKESFGKLELEPYAFYNNAMDQVVERAPDCRTRFGSYGFAIEHDLPAGFEWGAEVAANYGNQKMFNIDRNKVQIKNVNGNLVEIMTNISTDANGNNLAVANAAAIAASKVIVADQADGQPIPGYAGFYNAKERFRPAYTNKFGGWMGVADLAYTFKPVDLKLALAYGYASGDFDPHLDEKNKTYKGFVGFHELYSGKRVRSVYFLDERALLRPMSQKPGALKDKGSIGVETMYSDLQHVGLGLTWEPEECVLKKLSLNPNLIAFFKANDSYKYDLASESYTDEFASKYLGTEINLIGSCSVVKDLKLYGHLASFIPGGYFGDVKGVKLDKDYAELIAAAINPAGALAPADLAQFRIAQDVVFYANVGLEFKF